MTIGYNKDKNRWDVRGIEGRSEETGDGQTRNKGAFFDDWRTPDGSRPSPMYFCTLNVETGELNNPAISPSIRGMIRQAAESLQENPIALGKSVEERRANSLEGMERAVKTNPNRVR